MSPTAPNTTYTSIVDALLILLRDDHVLLARRQGTGYADGMWNLPSGKLEANETITQAAIREAQEEIGVHITEPDLRFAHLIHYRNPHGHARIGVFFHATHWTGTPHNAEPHKCSEVTWQPLHNLPSDTYPYTAQGLAAFTRQTPLSTIGWDSPRPFHGP
ncbi:NUDIX domain-containing protein [Actinocorallia sp. API 0066]|uniref:NUDIX hydrolase n=1 Tax=Actinocorallia sp. API 0066 TaxID=2896846 RepID=UPI001E4569D4|nr:NUDIX domain-containing protein [Actinocorallia sp. API 0066]MCD0450468.1 NUDIX domain-containing protein [Actinocorallia sp. API 0066]